MDPLLLVMMAVLALFVFMQFRASKKRKAEQEVLGAKMVPGAEVMTQFGMFGTLLSIDDDKNEALIETSPGTIVRVHRQTLLKVVEDDVVDAEPASIDEVSDTDPRLDGKSND